MRKSQAKNFSNGLKIQKVTKMPNCLLKIKGRLDAKKPSSVADSYCSRLRERCSAIESAEVIIAEQILYDYRREAAQIMSSICDNRDVYRNHCEEYVGDSPIILRANARNRGKRAATGEEITRLIKRLCEIGEKIIDVDTTLEERVFKTRYLCSEKIAVYSSGLHAGGAADYEYTVEYPNRSIELYREKHRISDEAIRRYINNIFTEEV